MVLLADALRSNGDSDDALAVLAEASTLIDETGERYYEAEVYRVRAALLLARGGREETEAIRTLSTANEIARTQGAKSLQLRAAHDLAVLWADDGKRQKAREFLTAVCDTFTAEPDSPAVVSSRQFLEALR